MDQTVSKKSRMKWRAAPSGTAWPPLKGVVGGGIFPKHGQVGVQVLAHKSPQDHCAVQSHADIAGADGQMEQKVLPEGGVFRVPLVHALKELLQRDAEGVPNPPVGAVGLQAAPLAAGAGQSAGLHAQVAELGARHRRLRWR